MAANRSQRVGGHGGLEYQMKDGRDTFFNFFSFRPYRTIDLISGLILFFVVKW